MSILKQPYPYLYTLKYGVIISLGIGLFVFSFTWLFEPFNVSELVKYDLSIVSLGYGFIAALVCSLLLVLLPKLAPHYFTDRNWTVGKEILWIAILLLIVGVCNFGYHLLVEKEGTNSEFSLLLISLRNTIFIGLIPAVFITLINRIRLMKKYGNEIVLNEVIKEKTEEEIVIVGENKGEVLKVLPSQFLYAEANANYSEVVYLEENNLKREVIRISLTGLEEFFSDLESIQRVHRKYIANLSLVKKVSGNAQGYKLNYQNDLVIPVSRNKSGLLKQ